MTKKQLREHKQGNQERKKTIQYRQRNGTDKNYWAKFGLIQNGKYTLALLASLLALSVSAADSITNAGPSPLFELPAIAPTPVKEVESVLGFLRTQATNWVFANYGIYDSSTKKFGAGIAAAYPLNEFMSPTIRFDWINGQLWQPSGSFTLQYPVHLLGGKLTVVPFGFGGIATPISGQGAANGTITDIYGFGLAVALPQKPWWPQGIVMDWEQWGTLKDNQYRFGVLWRF